MEAIEPEAILLQRLVDRLVTAVRPERIIPFGSCARGDAAPDSDIGLFVQVEPGRDVGEVTRSADAAIRPFRAELTRPVDIVVKDRAFVERYGSLVSTILRPVLGEGRVLYAG